jgi:hypothetical protein
VSARVNTSLSLDHVLTTILLIFISPITNKMAQESIFRAKHAMDRSLAYFMLACAERRHKEIQRLCKDFIPIRYPTPQRKQLFRLPLGNDSFPPAQTARALITRRA